MTVITVTLFFCSCATVSQVVVQPDSCTEVEYKLIRTLTTRFFDEATTPFRSTGDEMRLKYWKDNMQ